MSPPIACVEHEPVTANKPTNEPQSSVETTSLTPEQRLFPDNGVVTGRKLQWGILSWMIAVHAGALLAPFYFSWQMVLLAFVAHWITISWGIGLGYHRLLAHRSFKLWKPFEYFIYLCGALSGQGSPLFWAAVHRVHHRFSDHEGDPHSPRDGTWWSHMAWLFPERDAKAKADLYKKYAPDLLADPVHRFIDNYYGLILIMSGVALYAIGGMPWLVYGLFVRIVVGYQGTWTINSATHIWGYRTYNTTDDSKNLWWSALLTYGEGWHNNHHAYPALARNGHKWYEIDITFYTIKLLELVGIAYDVKDKVPTYKYGDSRKASS